MKKIICLLLLFGLPMLTFADWQVTVTWTRSVGPNLDYEEVFMNAESKCRIEETDTTSCSWAVENLSNQEIKIKSTNTQGAWIEYNVGQLFEVPTPASGGTISVIYVAP